MKRIRVALLGIGKIARDQHVPALAADDDFELVAAVSRNQRLDDVPNYTGIDEMLDAEDVDAVSICTPPQVRYPVARLALERKLDVMLEKPPGATLNEVQALVELAEARNVALYATWHSRESVAVAEARKRLAELEPRRVTVTWKEDVRVWHPGQKWIWEAGGLGVFDPGINALSILTTILPGRMRLVDAELSFPSNCETPIAATLELASDSGVTVSMDLDFLQTGPPTWDIAVETDAGPLLVSKGGTVFQVADEPPLTASDREYPNLYAHFAELVRNNRIDVDVEPFRLVADAFLCGRRRIVEPFVE